MNIQDISANDMATLTEQGYTEADLGMLAPTEIQALLGSSGSDSEDDGEVDRHARAAEEQDEQREQEEGEATGNVATQPAETGNVATPATPTYTADVPADLAEQIAAMKQKERDSFKSLMDGVIDADQYLKDKEEAEAAIDSLKSKAMTAAIFADVNRQNAEQRAEAEWKQAQETCFAAFKGEGLDYRNPERPALLAAFNHRLKGLADDPKNEKRDGAWFLQEAHRLTKTDLGIVGKPAATPSRGVDMSALPPTLRSAPLAASSEIGGDEFAHMRNLEGLALERAHAALTDAQRDRWMAE